MRAVNRIVATIVAGCLCLGVSSVLADTYRWKDQEGKVHYGSAVPAEYAEQPYDVLNKAGLVIEHVEDTSIPIEVRVEKEIEGKKPLISDEERQLQSDRLLVIRYRSEEEINNALEQQISQLGFDSRIIDQSFASTNKAIRNQIRQAADQQRANQQISDAQLKEIDKLYARRARDKKKRAKMDLRENRIRARFQVDLERYRSLTSEAESTDKERRADEEQANPG